MRNRALSIFVSLAVAISMLVVPGTTSFAAMADQTANQSTQTDQKTDESNMKSDDQSNQRDQSNQKDQSTQTDKKTGASNMKSDGQSTQNDQSNQTNSVCSIGDVTYESLAEAVGAAQNGDTIKITKDITEYVTVDGKKITIDLDGHVITAAGEELQKKAIKVNSNSEVTIKNGTIKGSDNNYNKGAAVFNERGKVELINITLKENIGHALLNYGTALIKDSLITENTDSTKVYGQTIMNYGDGAETLVENTRAEKNNMTRRGLFCNNMGNASSKLTIKDSDIVDNKLKGGAVEVYSSGTLNLNNTTIKNNISTDYTGGVYLYSGTINMTNSAVYMNEGTSGNDFYIVTFRGGEIPLAKDMYDHGIRLDNYVSVDGSKGTVITVPRTKTTGTNIRSIDIEEKYNLTNVAEFNGQTFDTIADAVAAATAAGEGNTVKLLCDIKTNEIIADAKNVIIDLNNHTITANSKKRAAIQIEKSKNVTVKNGTFTGCKYKTGGAFTATDTTLTVEDVIFKNNDGNPVRIYHNPPLSGDDLNPCKVTMKGCSFIDNGLNEGNYTAYACAIMGYSADIENCVFKGNYQGLRIANSNAVGDKGNVSNITNCEFTENKGSTLILYSSADNDSNVTGCTFKNNTITNKDSNNKAIICLNQTEHYGKNPRFSGGTDVFKGCEISGNSGGEYTVLAEAGEKVFENCLIKNNTADETAGIYADPFCHLKLKNTVIKKNHSEGEGLNPCGGVTLHASTYYQVSVAISGGTVLNPDDNGSQNLGYFYSKFEMEGGAIYNNTTDKEDGAADLYVCDEKSIVSMPDVTKMKDGDIDFTSDEWTKNTHGTVVHKVDIEEIYIDKENGNDEDEGHRNEPVKTFKRAVELLNTYPSSKAIVPMNPLTLSDIAQAANDGTAANGTKPTGNMTAGKGGKKTEVFRDGEGNVVLDLGGKEIKRDQDLKTSIINVAGGEGLLIKNTVINGEERKAEEALLTVSKGASLTLDEGAVLKDNGRCSQTISLDDGREVPYAENEKDIPQKGGAILSSGNVVINDGVLITNNQARSGGAIFAGEGSLTINGGKIEGNGAYPLAEDFKGSGDTVKVSTKHGYGGGVGLAGSCKAVMNGGNVSDNFALHSGGGIAVGASRFSGEIDNTSFVMNGGKLGGNYAYSHGGGLFVQCCANAEVFAGEIVNNKAIGDGGIFAGGGIYVNGYHPDEVGKTGVPNGKLKMYNVAIGENTAEGEGGAMAWCGSGSGGISEINGLVVYDNTSKATSEYVTKTMSDGEKTYSQDPCDIIFSTHYYMYKDGSWSFKELDELLQEIFVPCKMLNGGDFNWKDETGRLLSKEELHHNKKLLKISTDASAGDQDVQESLKKATVFVTGNSSFMSAGGIGCNGDIEFGTTIDYTDVEFEKKWSDEGHEGERPGSVKIDLLRDGDVIDSMIIEADKDGNWKGSFKDLPLTEVDENGTPTGKLYKYTVEEDMTYAPEGGEATGHNYQSEVSGVGDAGAGDVGGADDRMFTITNTYIEKPESKPVAEPVKAIKTLDGKAPAGRHFTFELADESGKVVETAKNNDGGAVSFTSLRFEEEGVYKYTISEKTEDDSSIRFDKNVFGVVITVTKEGNELKAEIAYDLKGKSLDEGVVPLFKNETVPVTPPGDGPDNPGDTPEDESTDEPSKPNNPPEDESTDNPKKPNNSSTTVKKPGTDKNVVVRAGSARTGDDTPIGMIMIMAAIAGAVVCAGTIGRIRIRARRGK